MQEKLIIIRKKRNVSQQELADLIDISLNQYCAKENGKYKFNGDEMFLIAKRLEMKIEDIFLPTYHQNGESNSSSEEREE